MQKTYRNRVKEVLDFSVQSGYNRITLRKRRRQAVKILEPVQKIPGGLMLVPMAAAALIHTFCPRITQLGNPLSAVFSSNGTMCVVGMMLVFAGIQTRPQQFVLSLRRCGVLILLKLIFNILLCAAFLALFGKPGIAGISLLAFAAALTSCNPGVYIALMNSVGDAADIAGFALLNLVGLPFVPICILGFADGNGIQWASVAATILPFALGMGLASLDPAIRNFAASGTPLLLPFLGFCLGSSINLKLAFSACGSGLLLFAVVMALNLAPLLAADRLLLHQRGHCTAAICCVAGLAITVPSLMAQNDAAYLPYVDTAAAQVAFAVILSAVCTPVLVRRLARR